MNKKDFQMGQTVSDYVVFNKYSGPSVALSTDITQWMIVIECINNQRVLKSYFIHVSKQPESE